MPRVLFFVNAQCLGQTLQCQVLARALTARGYELLCVGTGRYLRRFRADGQVVSHAYSVPQEVLDSSVRDRQYYPQTQDMLLRQVDAELGLYEQFRPDLVIQTNRFTASMSAAACGLPEVALTSAVAQAGFESTVPVPQPPTQFLGALAACARRLGLEGGQTLGQRLALLADSEDFVPLACRPAWAQYAGPLALHQSYSAVAPRWLPQVLCGARTVYASLGSTGLMTRYLDDLVTHFAGTSTRVAVSSGGRWRPDQAVPGAYVTRHVREEELLDRCSVVVCHGGLNTVYRALSRGVPVVVITEHWFTDRVGELVARHGVGVALRSVDYSPRALIDAVEFVRPEGSPFRERAAQWRDLLMRQVRPERAAALVELLWLSRGSARER